MIKVATLICRKSNGSLVSRVDQSADTLTTTAKEARASGTLGGEAITEGVVMATWKSGVVYKFKVGATPETEPKKRKAKNA